MTDSKVGMNTVVECFICPGQLCHHPKGRHGDQRSQRRPGSLGLHYNISLRTSHKNSSTMEHVNSFDGWLDKRPPVTVWPFFSRLAVTNSAEWEGDICHGEDFHNIRSRFVTELRPFCSGHRGNLLRLIVKWKPATHKQAQSEWELKRRCPSRRPRKLEHTRTQQELWNM